MKLDKAFNNPYNPNDWESKIYKKWEQNGMFNPDNFVSQKNIQAETFSVMLPPPNATGTLHIGHAYEDSIQDIVVRFQRMRGKRVLWLPGTDHAAIAVNTKVERELVKREKKNRHDIGRDAFVARVEAFVDQSRGTIQQQIRRVGASVDWSREAFTLDSARSLAVKTAFKRMYDAGLVYRKNKVINWDPKGQTTVSDDEVVHKAEKGTLYTFKYSKDFPIYIATSRPETKVGDTAVAVHPDDKRYMQYIGREYNIDFAGAKLHIQIIGDTAVDQSFGTGAVGLTPAHSLTDAEIAVRHNLPSICIINEYAKMTDNAGTLVSGKKTSEARLLVVDWLKENNLLQNETEVDQNITVADRSGGVIEPLPKLQWFIDVNKPLKSHNNKSLKELMLDAVKNGSITVEPDRFKKIYFHWVNNLRDWCISRQLWYGHKIPVWYKNNEIYCDIMEPSNDEGWTQDTDTLDTWFSSALWTFSTLGWPKKTKDLKMFHPTSFMAPGYEILFFWVARMILMSTFLLKEVPFKQVYLHGMVRDAKGQKFSKSLNNGIDPIEVIDQYGADALRMSLIVGVAPGNDSNFDLNKVKGYKHFANKIWNATKFVLMNSDTIPIAVQIGVAPKTLTTDDKQVLNDLNLLIKDVTDDMEHNRFYLVAEKLYHYFWHTYADVIIESSKLRLASDDKNERANAQYVLWTILYNLIIMLHPFMPFVTEVVWELIHNQDIKHKMLIVTSWPNWSNKIP